MQHTAMGILWWTGGLVGTLMTWHSPANTRNLLPALILALTGLSMAAHAQHSPTSGQVHTIFGTALVLAGLMRMAEILMIVSGVLHEDRVDERGRPVHHPFQVIPILVR